MVDGVDQPGLFQRIGNFFGADDPNAGQPTDPFANLSRSQRTMLGFAALRDAAASLEGRDSNFFQSAMGGFEQARERERLRAQGEFANRNQALFQLAQLEFLANQPGNEGLRPLIEAQRQMLVGQVGSAVPAISLAADGAMPSSGAMPTTVAPSQGGNRLPREAVLDPVTGQTIPYTGEPEGPQPTPAPAVTAPTVLPAVADLDSQIADTRRQIDEIIQAMPTGANVTTGAFLGVPVGDDPRAQARLAQLQGQETRLLADRERVVADQVTAAREEEQRVATQNRMEPLINDALGFLLDEDGNIRSITSQIANVSGFGAGLMPGVDAADARLARAAVTELGAIAAMGSVREARNAGFGGSLSDADILLIQQSGGTFDLAQPEATADTLRRLEQQISRSSNTSGETVTLPDGTEVRIRVRN